LMFHVETVRRMVLGDAVLRDAILRTALRMGLSW